MSHVFAPILGFEYLNSNSFAMFTEAPGARRAVVFVHGFAGHPLKTWSRMQDLIATDDTWKETDAYFIGYRSTRDEVSPLVGRPSGGEESHGTRLASLTGSG
jgi:hypothetical protein